MRLSTISVGILLGLAVIYASADDLASQPAGNLGSSNKSTAGTLELTSSIGIIEVKHFAGGGLTMSATLRPVTVDLEGLSDAEVLSHHGIVDVNGDDITNARDLLIILSEWGVCRDPSNCASDVDHDGFVSVADLVELILDWH